MSFITTFLSNKNGFVKICVPERLWRTFKWQTHLYALTVIEEHVAQLFGDHVQMSLLPLVGPGQNVELGEVRREIIERSDAKQKTNHMKTLNWVHEGETALKWFQASIRCYVTCKQPQASCKIAVTITLYYWLCSLYGGEDRIFRSQEHKRIFLISKESHLLRSWWPEKVRNVSSSVAPHDLVCHWFTVDPLRYIDTNHTTFIKNVAINWWLFGRYIPVAQFDSPTHSLL